MNKKRFCLQWKDPDRPARGTLWTYMDQKVLDHGKVPSIEEGMNGMMTGHRPSVCMRGIKWLATWKDGTEFTIRSSPQATKPLMCSIVKRWGNPPIKLKKDGGKPFSVDTLQVQKESFVYLVRLLTFEETAKGGAYFKIGKAVSVPSRIKEFGPCRLIAQEKHSDDAAALRREAELHKTFAKYRRTGTEIFLLTTDELERVVREIRSQ